MKTEKTPFNPDEHLIKAQGGKDYLPVAYRIVWFREKHPDWGIETVIERLPNETYFAKATIKDEQGRVRATSHKIESHKNFPKGAAEKAETGAIGRALALCGFGTQFETDFDEGERVVDAPITRANEVAANFADRETGFAPNEYLIPFGKHQGKALSEISDPMLKGYIEWLSQQPKQSEQSRELIERAEAYLQMKNELQ